MTDNHITRETWDGSEIICLHVFGVALVFSELDYNRALTRGKQWRIWQDRDRRMRQRQAEDEAAQLDWIR